MPVLVAPGTATTCGVQVTCPTSHCRRTKAGDIRATCHPQPSPTVWARVPGLHSFPGLGEGAHVLQAPRQPQLLGVAASPGCSDVWRHPSTSFINTLDTHELSGPGMGNPAGGVADRCLEILGLAALAGSFDCRVSLQTVERQELLINPYTVRPETVSRRTEPTLEKDHVYSCGKGTGELGCRAVGTP